VIATTVKVTSRLGGLSGAGIERLLKNSEGVSQDTPAGSGLPPSCRSPEAQTRALFAPGEDR
jgi:hypothetical protein